MGFHHWLFHMSSMRLITSGGTSDCVITENGGVVRCKISTTLAYAQKYIFQRAHTHMHAHTHTRSHLHTHPHTTVSSLKTVWIASLLSCSLACLELHKIINRIFSSEFSKINTASEGCQIILDVENQQANYHNARIRTLICTRANTRTHAHALTQTRTRANRQAHTQTHKNHKHIHTRTHSHTHTRTQILTNTHTHAHIPSSAPPGPSGASLI